MKRIKKKTICEICGLNFDRLHKHHIIPQSKNGSNENYNIIWCCPLCHSNIFIDENEKGIHGKKISTSIQIIKWYNNRSLLEIYNIKEDKYILLGG